MGILQARFEGHSARHPGMAWKDVLSKLKASPEKLYALSEMERTGGDPDVIGMEKGEYLFADCSVQTPKLRTSVCYDREGLESRKEHRPRTSAMDLAAEMGVRLLTESEYLALQALGEIDTKTSSWIATPPAIRKLGGDLHGECRYGRVFVGHNGAQSYYGVRGFRAILGV